MLTFIDENGTIQLTEKALHIGPFRKLYDSVNPELGVAYFAMMYYMYAFDSKFARTIEDESQRLKEVRKFVHLGDQLKVTRTTRKAMDMYKELYDDEAASMYTVMRDNVQKLKNYAKMMTLVNPNAVLEDGEAGLLIAGVDFVLVDAKEFMLVNNMLPKQEEELTKFEVQLQDTVKNKIDIYGGGQKGAYE